MFLVCQLILQDHVIKRSCDFMDGSPSLQATTLPTCDDHGIVAEEIRCF